MAVGETYNLIDALRTDLRVFMSIYILGIRYYGAGSARGISQRYNKKSPLNKITIYSKSWLKPKRLPTAWPCQWLRRGH